MSGFDGLGSIGQVALTVGDVEAATAFYRDRLGMRLLFEAGGMSFFDCGDVRLMLGPGEGGPGDGGGGMLLYFEVPDMSAAHAELSERGVSFVEAPRKVAEMDGIELWLAFFRDEWGNVLALMSETPSS